MHRHTHVSTDARKHAHTQARTHTSTHARKHTRTYAWAQAHTNGKLPVASAVVTHKIMCPPTAGSTIETHESEEPKPDQGGNFATKAANLQQLMLPSFQHEAQFP